MLLEITFSITNGDRFVIGVSIDSIIMNLEKCASVSLSESVSIRIHLSFFEKEKAMSVI